MLIQYFEIDKDSSFTYQELRNGLARCIYAYSKPSLSETFVVQDEFEIKSVNRTSKETHICIYDKNYGRKSYFAIIKLDSQTKIEFSKKYKENKLIFGESKTYFKQENSWVLKDIKEIGEYNWPPSTTKSINHNTAEGFGDLLKIKTLHFIGSFEFEEKTHLVKNIDSLFSFLPYKLASNLETGSYKIYKKFRKDFMKSQLLIDANILEGQLHGVYN